MSYSSYVHDILEISGAKEGDLLSIKGEGQELMGTLMPHHEFSHPDILIIKLRNGYNCRCQDNARDEGRNDKQRVPKG